MASAWANGPLYQSVDNRVMPRLSDSMIQSVKLRSSGADSYVDPSPFLTKMPLERRQHQRVMSASDVGQSVQGGDPHSWAYLDRRSPLPSLLALSVEAARYGDGDSTSPFALTRLGKRGRYEHEVAAEDGREERRQGGARNNLAEISSPHQPPAPNSETCRVSSTTTSFTSRDSNSTARHATKPDLTAMTPTHGAGAASTAGSAASNTSAGAKPKKKRVRVKTERRREQCRANQARYRNKQRALRLAFHETLDYLREEVKELEAKRRALSYGLHIKKSPWNVVVDYFRLFRHGACVRPNEYPSTSAPAESSVAALYSETEYGEKQLAFLRSVMVPDVNIVGSEVNGIDAIAEQWVSWSRSCSAFELHLERIEKAPGQRDTLAATAMMCVTITDSTVRNVFPHLLARQDRDGGEHEGHSSDGGLAWKLCGQRLEFKCVMWFECNPRTCQVLSLRSQFDIVPPLLRVLGSLRDVARVLDGARLTSGGFLPRTRGQQMGNANGGLRSAPSSLSAGDRGISRDGDKDECIKEQDMSVDSKEGDSDNQQ